ncbi:MAG: 16S rRNA (guanine(527)-N(7))-methyltransferase RsmG [Nannocystaceae bacterium]|nr:class I SAM-dependent methyltransferase [bacterium]
MIADELEGWMRTRQWTLEGETCERLEALVGLWLRYGAVMNLTSARTREALLPHIIDGLDTAWLVRSQVGVGEDYRWLDLGSGGGFPGLVLAAVGQWPLLLVEPRQKRASFLELALRSIGCSSIEVRCARFERATWEREAANGYIRAVEPGRRICSARAVWEPKEWLEVAHHVGETGAHVVMHLGEGISSDELGVSASIESARGRIAIATAG